MRMAGIREIREKTAEYLGGEEPFFVMKHGKLTGVFIPLTAPRDLPDDWRREIAGALGSSIARLADQAGLTDKALREDFDAHRRGRRGR